MEKEFEELCERTGHTELDKRSRESKWMRCIRQCWIMDGTENGSCVPMMHSLEKVGYKKNAKKESIFIEPQGILCYGRNRQGRRNSRKSSGLCE